jgi:hypothetical protein
MICIHKILKTVLFCRDFRNEKIREVTHTARNLQVKWPQWLEAASRHTASLLKPQRRLAQMHYSGYTIPNKILKTLVTAQNYIAAF